MKHKSLAITIAMLVLMPSIVCIPAFAVTDHLVSIPTNQVWVADGYENHNTSYNHVGVNVIAVTPQQAGFDFYSRIRCRIENSSGTLILDSTAGYVTLTEGGGVWPLLIKNGYYNTSKVYYRYSGNSNAAAYATVNNYGTFDTTTYTYW